MTAVYDKNLEFADAIKQEIKNKTLVHYTKYGLIFIK
jgi:hypothetical protein